MWGWLVEGRRGGEGRGGEWRGGEGWRYTLCSAYVPKNKVNQTTIKALGLPHNELIHGGKGGAIGKSGHHSLHDSALLQQGSLACGPMWSPTTRYLI